MFLILLIGAFCLPGLSFLLTIIFYLKQRKPVQSAILIGTAYAVIFYNYIPDSGNDSVRHMAFLANYQGIPIWKCFNAGHYSQLYVWDIWNWIVAQFHMPYLIQASGAFLGFSIISYIVFDYCMITQTSKRNIISAIVLVLMATNPIGYAVGIRSSCAYIICTLGIYLSEIHSANKIKVFILMILAIFIHHSAALLLLVWIFVPLFSKMPMIMTILIGCLILEIVNIMDYVLPVLSGLGTISDMVLDASNTISIYQEDSRYNVLMSTSLKSRVELGCSLLYIMAIIVRNARWFPVLGKVEKKYKKCTIAAQTYYMNNIACLYFVVALVMLEVLTLNGNRYLQIPEVLVIVPLIFSFEKRDFCVIKRDNLISQFGIDSLILGMSALHLFLNLYSLAWGDASFGSFIGGLSCGAIYALIC